MKLIQTSQYMFLHIFFKNLRDVTQASSLAGNWGKGRQLRIHDFESEHITEFSVVSGTVFAV